MLNITTTMFQTGEIVPAEGLYRLVSHADGSYCEESSLERLIQLNKGEVFPPCKSNNKSAKFVLEIYA